MYFIKKLFLKISLYSQENTCNNSNNDNKKNDDDNNNNIYLYNVEYRQIAIEKHKLLHR